MGEHSDPKRKYPWPDETAGKVSKGAKDFEELAKQAGEENRGEVDFLQGGVVAASDYEFTAIMETESTGTIKSVANTGGTAWIPDATIGLMRTVTASGSAVVAGLKPASLPASGKYMAVGIELAGSTWNIAATVSVLSGTEKTTQAEAEAASPGVSANKIRVRDCILFNNGGSKYELKAQFDRRRYVSRWPLTFRSSASSTTVLAGETVEITATGQTATVPNAVQAGAGALVGLIAGASATEVKVKSSGGTFNGDFTSAASEIKLATLQHVLLQSDATNWFIVAGEPKREAAYTARAEVTFNSKHAPPLPTRAAMVSIDVELAPSGGSGIGVKVLVGGVAVVELFAAINGTGVRQCFTFELQPGEEWEVTYAELSGAKAAGLHASYKAL
jgi:hypothetical protein